MGSAAAAAASGGSGGDSINIEEYASTEKEKERERKSISSAFSRAEWRKERKQRMSTTAVEMQAPDTYGNAYADEIESPMREKNEKNERRSISRSVYKSKKGVKSPFRRGESTSDSDPFDML